MNPFRAEELNRMQAAQEAGMMDACTVLRYESGGEDEYGMPIERWTEGATIACGYDGRRRSETGVPAGTDLTQVGLTDGRLRLPIDTVIGQTDRIRLTHRFGELLENSIVFDLIGEARRGPSGLLVDVRKVIDGRG